ncbi:hypothetical protein FBFR_03675 [Flavobacterium fryxellicola]|uniref:Uncharacterized protein n=1 Tax=Flavobacterium fryxellicola TaxID=249352 RepID=A0A162P8B7_9FLAO|nr:hypothetical protein FBFR_03675 [Flavobacterium fryxellicola]
MRSVNCDYFHKYKDIAADSIKTVWKYSNACSICSKVLFEILLKNWQRNCATKIDEILKAF